MLPASQRSKTPSASCFIFRGMTSVSFPRPRSHPRAPPCDVPDPPADRPLARQDRPQLPPRPLHGPPRDPARRQRARARISSPHHPASSSRDPRLRRRTHLAKPPSYQPPTCEFTAALHHHSAPPPSHPPAVSLQDPQHPLLLQTPDDIPMKITVPQDALVSRLQVAGRAVSTRSARAVARRDPGRCRRGRNDPACHRYGGGAGAARRRRGRGSGISFAPRALARRRRAKPARRQGQPGVASGGARRRAHRRHGAFPPPHPASRGFPSPPPSSRASR